MRFHTRRPGEPASGFELVLRARPVALASGIIIALLIAMHPVAVVAEGQDDWHLEIFRLALLRFDLDREQGVGTWAMATGLGLCGLMILSVASRAETWRGHWRLLGIIFVLLSLDEVASFHELMMAPVRAMFELPGFLYFAWVLPATAAVLLLGLLYLRFVLALPAETRSRVVAAGAIYLLGVLVLESFGASVFSVDREALSYDALVLAEETCEMLGIAIMLQALLHFPATTVGQEE